jgi:accessory gene regulator protein AgrB
LEGLCINERIILKRILRKLIERAWSGLIWLRIGTSGMLLRTRQWTFGFHIMCRIFCLVEELLASQGLCFTYFSVNICNTAVMWLHQQHVQTSAFSVQWSILYWPQRDFGNRL